MIRTVRRGVRRFVRLLALGIIATAIFWSGIVVAWALVAAVPSIDNFENRRVVESTKVYDRTGNVLLYDVHGTMRRTAVSLEDVSLNIRNATIAIEDDTFYQHRGVRPLATARAILRNLKQGNLLGGHGGSTITQQVVKNTLLTKDKTIIRKVKEWVLAIKLERLYTKDKILETYLNETPYGGTLYGVEEASQYFFGISAKETSLAQAAHIAALPQAPTRYSPYGSHREELEARKNLVLERMLVNGFITQAEFDTTKSETVTFKEEQEAGIKAPHFVFFVLEQIEEKYGASSVANGGLTIITTLDYELQKKAEDTIRTHALENEKKFNAENAGLVAIDPKTGQVITMVGSRGYFDEEIDGMVNVTVTPQQPGSAFKPFVYAAAFEKGYTPETVVFDLKTQFTAHCASNDLETHDECYSPENYDSVFRGPVTLRNALAQSINIPAVKVLYITGVEAAIRYARNMGISTLTSRDQYGLTLVLGGGEVYLLDMVSAYGVFANEGIRNTPVSILRVEDPNGKTLEEFKEESERVIPTHIANSVSDILSDDVARAPAFGEGSALHVPGATVAAKTGTTNDYRDAWIIGYTPTVVAGAWAGNNNNSPMEKRVAGFIVAPLWNEFMRYAVEKYPSGAFTPPQPDPLWDTLPPVLRGEWNTDPAQGVHSILYWIDKNNPRAPWSGGQRNDPQLPLWDYAVTLWSQGTSSIVSTPTPSTVTNGTLSIVEPKNGSIISRGTTFAATVEHPNPPSVNRVAFYLNGQFVGSVAKPPYVLPVTPTTAGTMTLRAVAESQQGSMESFVTFSIK